MNLLLAHSPGRYTTCIPAPSSLNCRNSPQVRCVGCCHYPPQKLVFGLAIGCSGLNMHTGKVTCSLIPRSAALLAQCTPRAQTERRKPCWLGGNVIFGGFLLKSGIPLHGYLFFYYFFLFLFNRLQFLDFLPVNLKK